MKFSRIVALLAATALSAVFVMAETPATYDVTFDVAYYPDSAHVSTGIPSAPVIRYAPITGAFSGAEARVTFARETVAATPLGDHWLLADANVAFKETLEVSPVSVKPGVSASFTPVPFIVLSGGAEVGTGWTVAGIKGMAKYNGTTYGNGTGYDDLATFSNLFAKYWVQGTFQFDTGAIFPGEWNHVQMMYSYQAYCEGLTGMEDTALWMWQGSARVNGLKEYQQAILAYQMPLVLSRVGVIYESDKYYDDAAVANTYYKAATPTYNLSAMGQLSLSEKDTVTILVNFGGRRTFAAYDETKPEQGMITTGMEFFFNRVAVSYNHKF